MASSRKITLLAGLLLLLAGASAVWFTRGDLGETPAPERPAPRSGAQDAPEAPGGPSLPDPPDSGDDDPASSPGTQRVEVHVSEMTEGIVFQAIPGAAVVLREPGGSTQEAVADAAGIAVFERAPPGESEVRASAPGFARSAWARSDQAKRFVVLDRGIGLAGEVLDENGMRPVEGAEIRVIGGHPIHAGRETLYGLPPDPAVGVLLATARTGHDGRFLTDAVPPHRPVYVFASATGLGSDCKDTASSALEGPPTFVVLVLGRRGAVVGTVLAPDGRPADGATVYAAMVEREDLVALFADGSLPLRHVGNPELLTGRSGPDGDFRVEGLILGVPYVVAAAREGNAPSAPPRIVTATRETAEPRLDLHLRLPGKLVVKILGPDGEPIPDASVTIGATNWGGSTVPGSGVHEFWSLRVEEVCVMVRAPGFPPRRVRQKILSGSTAEITVRLESGIPMDGVVLDREGRPVSGAEVTARVLDEEGWLSSYATGRTNEEGVVRLTGLLPLVHRVTARAKDLAAGFLDHAPRGGPFRIVLGPGGWLRGNVRSEAGGPAQGVIEATGPDTLTMVLREEGGYEFRLPPGQYRLRTWTESQPYWGEWSHAVEVLEGLETKFDLVAR